MRWLRADGPIKRRGTFAMRVKVSMRRICLFGGESRLESKGYSDLLKVEESVIHDNELQGRS